MGGQPLSPPRHRRHGGPLPRRLANVTRAHPQPPQLYTRPDASRRFRRFSPCCGQVAHALRTLPPVAASRIATTAMPLDLHVLGLPLAFILSQDQTLHRILSQYLLADPSAPDSSVQEINALSYCFGTSFVLLFQSCQ